MDLHWHRRALFSRTAGVPFCVFFVQCAKN